MLRRQQPPRIGTAAPAHLCSFMDSISFSTPMITVSTCR
jgi:hypothetical protein